MMKLDLSQFEHLKVPAISIDPSFISTKEISARIQDSIKSVEAIPVKPIEKVLEEQLKPLLDKNQETVNSLLENYNQLVKLNEMKEQELLDAKAETQKVKRYNRWMMVISILALLVAMASLVVSILLR